MMLRCCLCAADCAVARWLDSARPLLTAARGSGIAQRGKCHRRFQGGRGMLQARGETDRRAKRTVDTVDRGLVSLLRLGMALQRGRGQIIRRVCRQAICRILLRQELAEAPCRAALTNPSALDSTSPSGRRHGRPNAARMTRHSLGHASEQRLRESSVVARMPRPATHLSRPRR